MTSADLRRRPIAVRGSGWAKAATAWLTARGVAPNQISLSSIAFAALGAAALGLAGLGSGASATAALYILAIICIYGRLLANLFDGMVAVEGGKGSPAGELFNEIPDRIADFLFFAGAGLATGSPHGIAIGLLGAFGAVMTAYVRALGCGLGLPADFGGPMAKPHRMHSLAAILLVCALTAAADFDRTVLLIGLAAIAGLTWRTVWLRFRRARDALMARHSASTEQSGAQAPSPRD